MHRTYLVVVGGFAGLQFVLRVLVADAIARHFESIYAGRHLLVIGKRGLRRRRPAESLSGAFTRKRNLFCVTILYSFTLRQSCEVFEFSSAIQWGVLWENLDVGKVCERERRSRILFIFN